MALVYLLVLIKANMKDIEILISNMVKENTYFLTEIIMKEVFKRMKCQDLENLFEFQEIFMKDHGLMEK